MTDDRDQRRATPDEAAPAAGSDASAAAAHGPARNRIDEAARRRLGRDLRLLYASVLNQPLPDRFMRLVEELDAESRNKEG